MLKIPKPPDFNEEEVKKILKKHYGIEGEDLPLVGDIGRNFHVIDKNGEEYIFKIANEIEHYYYIKAQNDLLLYLNSQSFDFRLPSVIKNKEGEYIY